MNYDVNLCFIKILILGLFVWLCIYLPKDHTVDHAKLNSSTSTTLAYPLQYLLFITHFIYLHILVCKMTLFDILPRLVSFLFQFQQKDMFVKNKAMTELQKSLGTTELSKKYVDDSVLILAMFTLIGHISKQFLAY